MGQWVPGRLFGCFFFKSYSLNSTSELLSHINQFLAEQYTKKPRLCCRISTLEYDSAPLFH